MMIPARFEAMIAAAVETRSIDFKRAMNWQSASKCERFEIIKDVAALSNSGGGHLIIGRDEPAFDSGNMSADELASFDTTAFNVLVHANLRPLIECQIFKLTYENDDLVVIEVPDFERTPLIFQQVSSCGQAQCIKRPHFKPGDVFIRTKAAQTQIVTAPDEMHEIISRAVRKTSDELVTKIQRMLSSPASVEEPLPTSPYDAEAAYEQQEFFGPEFYPRLATSGLYDMTLRPARYVEERIARRDTPNRILEFAAVVGRRGVFDSVPWEAHDQLKAANGARLLLRRPEWKRVEAVSLTTSGMHRIVRAFIEDFLEIKKPDGSGQRLLLMDLFVEQVTLFHLTARNAARMLVKDVDEELQFDFRISGLKGRTLSTDSMDPMRSFLLGLPGQPGSDGEFTFLLRTTRRALEVEAVKLARERCDRVLWTFGIRDAGVEQMQRELLRKTEPVVFP